ncbi:MAG TPA: hypothetical protein VFB16_10330 [Bauldia sp.]|nr:hypothetical protein [Bauldia sp.]
MPPMVDKQGELGVEAERRRRARSIAIAIGLGALVILFFVLTIARLGANVAGRAI